MAYIDQERVLQELTEACDELDVRFLRARTVRETIEAVKNHINAMPSADVAPVVHGRWELIRCGYLTSAFRCSACGRRVSAPSDKEKTPFYLKDRYPYCNCGAKMDGGAM